MVLIFKKNRVSNEEAALIKRNQEMIEIVLNEFIIKGVVENRNHFYIIIFRTLLS